MPHAKLDEFMSLSIFSAERLVSAENETVGKYAACAAPMRAFAAYTLRSACAMSGLRSSSSEGIAAGRRGIASGSGEILKSSLDGTVPTRIAMSFLASAIWRSTDASCAEASYSS